RSQDRPRRPRRGEPHPRRHWSHVMDDLRTIREMLDSRPPSAAATFQARNRLTAAIAGRASVVHPRHRRRAMRRALGGVAAAAGAAAVVVATTMTPATQAAHPTGPAAVAGNANPASAHDI